MEKSLPHGLPIDNSEMATYTMAILPTVRRKCPKTQKGVFGKPPERIEVKPCCAMRNRRAWGLAVGIS